MYTDSPANIRAKSKIKVKIKRKRFSEDRFFNCLMKNYCYSYLTKTKNLLIKSWLVKNLLPILFFCLVPFCSSQAFSLKQRKFSQLKKIISLFISFLRSCSVIDAQFLCNKSCYFFLLNLTFFHVNAFTEIAAKSNSPKGATCSLFTSNAYDIWR